MVNTIRILHPSIVSYRPFFQTEFFFLAELHSLFTHLYVTMILCNKICYNATITKNHLPFLFFCKLVSNDAAAQLPPGGPAGPWALRKTQDSLPGENFVARLRWYCHVSTMIENENGFKYSIWLSLLLWKDCLPDTHTLLINWWSGHFLFWLPHSGHWKPQGTSGSMHISINERLYFPPLV